MPDSYVIADTPEQIEAFIMLSLLGRLRLELKGFKFSSKQSTFAYIKNKYRFRGGRAKVLAAYESLLREKGILREEVNIESQEVPEVQVVARPLRPS